MNLTQRIIYLNVSRNEIGDMGARALALLIKESTKLRLLFMHYNRVLGFGGDEIAEAVGQSKSLQVLDISWNSICSSGRMKKNEKVKEEEKTQVGKKKQQPPKANKSFADLFARGFAESWSLAFAANNSLLHVDMSHNSLEQTDVEIIAEGLKEN